MQKRLFSAFLCLVCVLFAFSATANPNGAAQRAIVLASFGSTDAEARKVQEAFVQAVRERYAPTPVLLAVTSRHVQKTLKAAGQDAPSLFRVLADLGDAGYGHIAVQSMQVVAGMEYDGVLQTALAQQGLPKGISRVSVGEPLVFSNEHAAELAQALVASLPAERKAGEPVIFIGHGAKGPGGLAYPALHWHVQALDNQVYISTVEGAPALEDTLAALPEPGAETRRVWLAPLLALAGEHARNDIFGDEPDSWKSMVSAKGYECVKMEKALLALPAVRELWFGHLDKALEALDE